MRINSVTVRNYRIIREQQMDFNGSLTLIGGPNESGKSTFAEAIHRALFFKAKGNTADHRAMNSVLWGAPPEVELTFESGGATYLLKKSFGLSARVTLTPSHSSPLSGDAAETELARLLNVEAGLTGKTMTAQWGHLWVWQGAAGENPSPHATAEQGSLLKRLQGVGAAAALQSELDARVAQHFAEISEQIYSSPAKPRAGSELKRTEEDRNLAEQDLARARERVAKIVSTAEALEIATRELEAAAESLAGLETQQAETELKAQRLVVLRQQEAEQQPAVKSASDRHAALEAADNQILAHRLEVLALDQALRPQQEKIVQLEAAWEEAKRQASLAVQGHREAAGLVRSARLRRDLAVAHVELFEKAEIHRKLSETTAKVSARQKDLAALDEEVAKLPAVDKAKVRKLQKLESELSNASAALQAMATGLEVIAADQPVIVGSKPLEVGEKQILTESTEISLGSNFRLRIQPGGGTNLGEARRKEQDSRNSLQAALDSIPLPSVQEAIETHARLEALNSRAAAIKAEIQGMGADNIAEESRNAHNEVVAAKARVEQLAALAADLTAPADLAGAKKLVKEVGNTLDGAEEKESEAKARADVCAEILAAAEIALAGKKAETEQQLQKLNGLRAQLELLVGTHGDDAPRSQTLNQAKVAENAARNLLQATLNDIAELQPELLEGDRNRIKRAIDQKSNERSNARTRIAVARNELRSDGSADPQADLAAAEARARSARQYFASVDRNAKAVSLLRTLFQEEQRALAEQFTRPLAEKISAYLQCVLGPGAQAHVNLENSEFTSLRLSRPEDGSGAFMFHTLSGGAKEQLAAAVRLAMAEVLAADYGGCLPVVFDDAFTNTDAERVNKVQRMLDLAASRGLQVIVLTCNPADYAALGAKTTILRRERKAAEPAGNQSPDSDAKPPVAAPSDSDEPGSDVVAVTPITDEQRQVFLNTLTDLGGSSGNKALRDALGWDEPTYNAVKDDLVASGKIATGRGRGGSVTIKE